MSKHIIATVTNDLTYDQRMQRICTTLAKNGYQVTLVGRKLPNSLPLDAYSFAQKRLDLFFKKGMLFYAEYNIRLFFLLLFAKFDAVCTVDLDTMPAGCLASLLRRKKRVFDAHEYFTEVPEVTDRPLVKAVWGGVAKVFVPWYHQAYTVGKGLADIFSKKHHIPFAVVRNVPNRIWVSEPPLPKPVKHIKTKKIIFYQGALNEGRGIEEAIVAMAVLHESIELWLAGEGDLSDKLRRKTVELNLQDRVKFLGYVKPADLKKLTEQAWLGLNLLENKGLSYYYSLANKFFDYAQAEVPCLTMDFPEYRALLQEYHTALLLEELTPATIVESVLALINQPIIHAQMRQACKQASQEWIWQKEQVTLLKVWEKAVGAP